MRAYALPALAGSVSAGVSVPSRAGQKQNCFWHRVSLIFQGFFSIVARGQKQIFLNPRQFAFVSGLHIILDSPVNPIRFTRSASYASKRL
jgi:hypothetical protein